MNDKRISGISAIAMDLLNFPHQEDIYKYIANKLVEFAPEATILVNEIDLDKKMLQTRALAGLGNLREKIIDILGRRPVGMEYEIDETTLLTLTSDRITQFEGGLYELSFKRIPKMAAAALEKVLNLGGVYGMGIPYKGKLIGNIVILLPKNIDLENYDLVEAFIKLAALAIQRIKTEKIHIESEKRYRILSEISSDYCFALKVDLDENISLDWITDSFTRITGYSQKDVEDLGGFTEIILPEYRNLYLGKFNELKKDEEGSIEYQIKCKYGAIKWMRCFTRPEFNRKEKRLSAIYGSVKDITKQKRAVRALISSEEKFRVLFEGSKDLVFLTDIKGKTVLANPAWYEILGYTEENIGDPIEKIHPEDREYSRNYQEDFLDGKQIPETLEFRFLTAFGEYLWLEMKISPIMLSGKPYIACIARNVSERKRSEEALRAGEVKYRTLFEDAQNPILMVDKNGKYVDANKAALDFLECSRSELLRKKVWDWAPPNMLQKQKQEHAPFVHRRTLETEYYVKGKIKTLLLNVVPLKINEENILYGIGQNVTERIKAEQALKESERKYREVVENASDVIFTTDIEGNCHYINQAGAKKSGYSTDELINMNYLDLIHPDYKRIVQMHYMRQALKREPSSRLEYPFIAKSGETRWFSQSAKLIIEDGEPSGFYVFARDITARVKAEEDLAKSENQLRELTAYLQTAREQERTLLAREIHDELGQALTALKMDLSWLSRKLPEDKSIISKYKSMNELIDRTISEVQHLSSELRPGVLDDFGLAAAIEWKIGDFTERTGIKCIAEIGIDAPDIDDATATALYRILQEALTNITRHAEATEVKCNFYRENSDLVLEIIDNGKGFEQEKIESSQSYGLMGMRERALSVGCDISFESKPNKGTVVIVKAPV